VARARPLQKTRNYSLKPVPFLTNTFLDGEAMSDIDLERPIDGSHPDETDINLRAYLTRMSDKKLREFDPSWSDQQLMEWDGNFRSDGVLMLVCCERDIEVQEYRKVLEEQIQRRNMF
jgi:hypothetical protein